MFSLIASAAAAGAAFSAPVPAAGFEVETLATGLQLPTGIAFAPDGRIFVTEKSGTVRLIKNGTLLASPFITLTDVNSYGDRGLHGIALDPAFAQNGYVYLLYVYENTPGANLTGPKTGRLVRVTAAGDTASESSKVVLLGTVGGTFEQPSCEDYAPTSDCIPADSQAHSVGALRFAPDGTLYVSVGDGAHFGYTDPRSLRAQDLDRLSGKVLRINTDGTAPADNPYFNGASTANRSKVWMYGLRYPYRFGFRPLDGSVYIGDVGWKTWEEVDHGAPGSNFGWPCREGPDATVHNCTVENAVEPIHYYSTANGAAIIGGAFPGASYPAEYRDSFFFGDYVKDHIQRLLLNPDGSKAGVETFVTTAGGPVDVNVGPDGDLYYIGIYEGTVRRIVHTVGNRRPSAVIAAAPTSGLAPLTVAFHSTGSFDPDGDALGFLWVFGDGATSTESDPVHTYTADGSYTATLTVSDPEGRFDVKSVAIAVGNRAPQATISSPPNSSLYKEGDTIQLIGSGSDPEDGVLPASALHWQVLLHHNVHVHFLQQLEGSAPSFLAPDHDASDVYLELILTVQDSAGLTGSMSINLYRDNSPFEEGQNIVLNPSLEIEDPNLGRPKNWAKGGYGNNVAVLSYPVPGFDGAKGAQIDITQYTSGDRKWYFDPVYVTPGREYIFSDDYMSAQTSQLTVQFGYANGSYTYLNLGAVLPANAWTRVERRFAVPADARTATVFHALKQVGRLVVDNYWLGLPAPAQVVVTSPAAGVVVSGAAVPLKATVTASTPIAGVTFLVDGVPVGAEDTTPPYAATLNTTSLADGVHLVQARSRDTAGTLALSLEVRAVVLNHEPAGPNLISNPSLETPSGTPGVPQGWQTGVYGTNQTTFTYPVAGTDGASAAQIDVTSYSSGQARWYFDEVPVEVGREYYFTDLYKSSVQTTVWARFTLADGSFVYPRLGIPPASATWRKARYVFTAPANATSVTVLHSIGAVGFLVTDAFQLKAGPNLVRNGSAEVESPPGLPLGWRKGTPGVNDGVFLWPTSGVAGGSGLAVHIGSYTSGDAKWYNDDVAVVPGLTYVISDYRRATVPTTMKLRVRRPDGTYYYPLLGSLPAAPDWTRAEFRFVAPADAAAISVFHYLAQPGTLTTDELSISPES